MEDRYPEWDEIINKLDPNLNLKNKNETESKQNGTIVYHDVIKRLKEGSDRREQEMLSLSHVPQKNHKHLGIIFFACISVILSIVFIPKLLQNNDTNDVTSGSNPSLHDSVRVTYSTDGYNFEIIIRASRTNTEYNNSDLAVTVTYQYRDEDGYLRESTTTIVIPKNTSSASKALSFAFMIRSMDTFRIVEYSVAFRITVPRN